MINDGRPANAQAVLANLIDNITVDNQTQIKPTFRILLQDAAYPAPLAQVRPGQG